MKIGDRVRCGSEKNPLHVSVDVKLIFQCVQCSADPNTNPDIAHVNVVS